MDLESDGFSETLRFSSLSRFLSIEVDHPEVAHYIRSAFARVAADPAALGDGDSGAIMYRHRRYVSFNGDAVTFTKPDALSTPFRAAFYGSSKLFRLSHRNHPEYYSFYGAGLRIKGGAVFIASGSGTGKTTLSLGLLARGAQLYSDEYVSLRKSDREVSGLARTLMVRERTLSLLNNARLSEACFKLAPRQPARGGRVWDFVDAGAIFGEAIFAEPAPLSHLIVLERATGAVAKVERITPSIAAAALLPHTNLEGTGFDRLVEITSFLVDTPCYRLSAGKPQATVDAVLRLVGP